MWFFKHILRLFCRGPEVSMFKGGAKKKGKCGLQDLAN